MSSKDCCVLTCIGMLRKNENAANIGPDEVIENEIFYKNAKKYVQKAVHIFTNK